MNFYLIFFLLFLVSYKSALSATIEITDPSTDKITDINQEYEINLKLNINTSDNTKYYLRGEFFKKDTNKYCGFTYSGNSWFKGPYSSNEGWKNLPEILVSSNTASLKLKAKLDPDDADCNSSGDYNFKVSRYTQSGSSNTDDQNIQSLKVDINYRAPTKIPSPSKVPTSAPSKTPIIIPPTSKPIPTLESSPSVTEIEESESSESPSFELISPSIIPASPDATVAGISTNKKSGSFAFLGVLSGISLIFLSSFLWYKKIIRG